MASPLKKSPKTTLSSLFKLKSKTPKPSIPPTKSAILSEPDPDRLADLFQSSTASSPDLRGDRFLYKSTIQKLAGSNRLDLVERVLEAQKSDPSLPRSEGFLIRIMTLYSEAGMIDHALKTFDFITRTGPKHSERTFCALLSVFLKNRKLDRLIESFNNVPKTIKLSPGVTPHNIVLQGLCYNGKVEDARKVLDEMPNKGIKPNVVSYNALINGYLRKGDEDGCNEILKEMNEKGIEPNVATFNCRISPLCAKGRSLEAERLLDVACEKKLRPNRSMFNMIIEGYCKERNVESAIRVFERMKRAKEEDKDGASPDFVTYTVLIKSSVESGDVGLGLEMFEKLVARKWSPPFGAVRGLVEGLKKEERVEEAKEVVVKMREIVKGDAMDAWKSTESEISEGLDL